MSYNPRSQGAKCDECPLKSCRPVPPTVKPGPLAILLEGPGPSDEQVGRLVSGSAKYRLDKALRRVGSDPKDLPVNAAILCCPPHPLSPKDLRKALSSCKPRLQVELAGNPTVLALGASALFVMTEHMKVDSWGGTPLDSLLAPGQQVFATRNPNSLYKSPPFIPVFEVMVARAVALSRGQLPTFSWPKLVIEAQSEALHELFVLHQGAEVPIAIDIESSPSTSRIRCIGVGSKDLCVTIPFEGPDRDPQNEALLKALLYLPGPKVFQNAPFDLAELKDAGYVVNGLVHDTLLMHAVIAPRLPHDLSSIMNYEFPAERWKTIFGVGSDDKGKKLQKFDTSEIDKLMLYNAKDVAATILLYHQFLQKLQQVHNGEALNAQLHELSAIAMKMKTWGFTVAKENFDQHKVVLTDVLTKLKEKFTAMVPANVTLGKAGIQAGQAKYLFETLKVPVVARSEEGKPQLNAEALVTYTSMLAETMPAVADLCRVIYQYRKHAKLLGSYIENLPILDDGRVHPAWRVFGTRTGRWSASDPGIQTIPKKGKKANTPSMRNLFCAREGFVMMDCDYSQLELRIVALLSGDEKLLEWYAQGKDVHTMNAMEIFKTKTPTDSQRELAKRVVYGMNYGGSAKTIWRNLTADIPVPLETVELVFKGWFTTHPKIAQWQNDLTEKAKRTMYVEEALSGRRQYYYDGRVKPTEVVNFPVQGAAGELANRAVIAISKELNWVDEALIAQVHDSIVAECVAVKQSRLVDIVKGAMEQEITLNGAMIRFPIDIKVGTNWGHLEKLKL